MSTAVINRSAVGAGAVQHRLHLLGGVMSVRNDGAGFDCVDVNAWPNDTNTTRFPTIERSIEIPSRQNPKNKSQIPNPKKARADHPLRPAALGLGIWDLGFGISVK
jgi:hypothetical protein